MTELEGIGLRRLLRSGLDLPVLPKPSWNGTTSWRSPGTREQLEAAIPAIGRPRTTGSALTSPS
jgi:hypothetical protein